MAKKIVNHVEFANFILEKDRTGEFDTVKKVKTVTDTELLKQIINRLDKMDVRFDNIETTLIEHGKELKTQGQELKALRADVQGINTRIDNLVNKNNLIE
ncbi:MAG: hypothetical protein LBJ97_01245 [Mycoplasmataceae bacterium]|jgi:uncharacterized protein (UPF0335 family)|nr:hypothetical protein [Mycoplasmataceae bacterium]